MNSAVIVAGGVGERIGSGIPKQFVNVENLNKRIIDFSITEFSKNKYIDEVIIVVHKDWHEKILKEFSNHKVIIGGKTRYESSYNGLKNCSSDCEKVLIHDAARPFINQKIINDGINYLDDYDAAIPILDSSDSLIDISKNANNYLNRDDIKIIQTPQFFLYNKILNAYNSIRSNNNLTDDMSVMLSHNLDCKGKYFQGYVENFKITTMKDLELAISLLK